MIWLLDIIHMLYSILLHNNEIMISIIYKRIYMHPNMLISNIYRRSNKIYNVYFYK